MSDQAQKLRELVSDQNQPATAPGGEESASGNPPKSHVIAVTSGKGGVGKSNIAVNLAIALSREGQEVVVLDMDLGLANVNVLTDVTPRHTLLDVMENRLPLPEVMEEGPGGISIIAGAPGEEKLANVSEGECERLLQELRHLDEVSDYLLIDTAAGLSNRVMPFVCGADHTVLVTTPEPTAITDAYAIVKASVQRNSRPDFRLVINRADSILEAKKVGEKMKRVGREFLGAPIQILGYLEENNTIPRSVRERRPFVLRDPDSRPSRCVQHLSHRLTAGDPNPEPRGAENLFSQLMRWFQ